MPKEDPAIAKPGWVVKARRLAAPGSSLSEPKLVVPAVMPAMLEVPVLVRFPLASGWDASGQREPDQDRHFQHGWHYRRHNQLRLAQRATRRSQSPGLYHPAWFGYCRVFLWHPAGGPYSGSVRERFDPG